MLLRYLLSLIRFSSKYRKAAKISLETVYICSSYVQVSELIPITHCSVEEKLVPDVNKVTKNVTSLRWERFPLHVFRVTRCCSSARIRNKLYTKIPVNRFKAIRICISLN